MTDELQPTPQDEADLAAMNAEKDTDTIYILNRFDAALYDAAEDPVGVCLAMADQALNTLLGVGGLPDQLGITMGRVEKDGVEVIEFLFSTERPKGWGPLSLSGDDDEIPEG